MDYKIRYGWMEEVFPTPLPAVPGLELAGIVDEVGEGVTGAAVGDEVLGWSTTGAYAQYALAESFARKPADLGWAEAAALPVATETAQRVLDLLGVQAGETLLLHGAAGAVGSAATQLAVAAGATVVGTASPAGHEYLRELGALPVAYGDGLAERVRAAAPQGVDAVFDTAGKGVLPLSIELRGGTTERIVTIADSAAAAHGVTFSGRPRAAREGARGSRPAGGRRPSADSGRGGLPAGRGGEGACPERDRPCAGEGGDHSASRVKRHAACCPDGKARSSRLSLCARIFVQADMGLWCRRRHRARERRPPKARRNAVMSVRGRRQGQPTVCSEPRRFSAAALPMLSRESASGGQESPPAPEAPRTRGQGLRAEVTATNDQLLAEGTTTGAVTASTSIAGRGSL